MAQSSQTIKLLINELKNINCCYFCILRFINERNTLLYRNAEGSVLKILGEKREHEDSGSLQNKFKKLNPCSACLGLLQESQREEIAEKIANEVNDVYDADDVFFALSLPISLLIRNYSIWLYVKERFYSYYLDMQIFNDVDGYDLLKFDGCVVSLKEIWKSLAAPNIAKKLGKVLNNGADSKFVVNVNFEYNEDGQETACMAMMHPKIFGNRENQKRKYHNEVFTRKSVELALETTSKELFEANSPVPPPVPNSFIYCSNIVCCHDSIYIAGCYIHGDQRM